MYISRVILLPGKFIFDSIRRESKHSLYAVHQMLWQLFPDDLDATRDFLFREEKRGNLPMYFIVSSRRPVDNSGFFEIEIKDYHPVISVGQRLDFSLRANPVIAKKVEGRKNSIHHDVWMNAKREGKKKGLNPTELFSFIEEHTKMWLVERAERCGFSLDNISFTVDGYMQHHFYKKKKESPITFNSIDYKGILKVADVKQFEKTLFSGVGRSKSFGCGLMLVKRI